MPMYLFLFIYIVILTFIWSQHFNLYKSNLKSIVFDTEYMNSVNLYKSFHLERLSAIKIILFLGTTIFTLAKYFKSTKTSFDVCCTYQYLKQLNLNYMLNILLMLLLLFNKLKNKYWI